MNKTLGTTLTVIAVLAVAAVIFFAGSMYARTNGFGPSMMGGYGYNNANLPTLMIDQTQAAAEKYLANLSNSDLEIADLIVTPEQAVEYAQKYLDANIPGATTEHPMQFYGYYTLDFETDDKVAGMLSVNGYTGQVFLHTWHGTFVKETEYE